MYRINMVPEIVFGCGALNSLGKMIPEKSRVLIVSGSRAVKSGCVERIEKLLAPRETATFSGVLPEPTIHPA